MKRRSFIQRTAITGVGMATGATLIGCQQKQGEQQQIAPKSAEGRPIIIPTAICTWRFPEATAKAGALLSQGANALDAVIEGVAVEEANLDNTTVGIGATPDRDGAVTLDACVMAPNGDCGAVMAVENIVHVAALARKVMEETPHVILVGHGAEKFAYAQGFPKEDLLTETEQQKWEQWKKTSNYQPIINIENHDTIGMLTLDKNGDIAGACTTSGLGYKMKGRVGDSPIIGAGLFIDNEIGGAVATGLGEEVIKTVGSFLIVELMRQGKSPQQACEEAIARIVKSPSDHTQFQIAYIAMNKSGQTGSYSIHQGFSMMKYQNSINNDLLSDYVLPLPEKN
ncbi:MAG: N(4)-(beta-N-acetylglucosaminyl)-L-asparaginase [Dokdonia sp.]|jgi:N4-(beta-N-acetylglucosaminyl)-L-asparaginase